MHISIPPPYDKIVQPPPNRGVFICIDTETAEHHAGVITEIGVAVMRLHPVGRPDLPYSSPKIAAQHFVVKERSARKYRNGLYVPDHRDFFGYGTTQIAPLADIRHIWGQLMTSLVNSFQDSDPVYYVGHGISGDLNELRKMDFVVPDLPVVDTEKIWRHEKKQGKGNLTFLLEALCIPHSFPHNAGNDAYLNLQVFLALCDPVVRLEHNVGPDFNFEPRKPHKKTRRKTPIDYPIDHVDDYPSLLRNVQYCGSLDGYNRFISLGLEDDPKIPRSLPAILQQQEARERYEDSQRPVVSTPSPAVLDYGHHNANIGHVRNASYDRNDRFNQADSRSQLSSRFRAPENTHTRFFDQNAPNSGQMTRNNNRNKNRNHRKRSPASGGSGGGYGGSGGSGGYGPGRMDES